MTIPTREELLRWAENYVALWNAGDKEGWARNWRSVAPGEFRMLDPVGTPEKLGFEHCCLDSFDLFQPHVKYRIASGTLFVCANEVAWLMENHTTVNGRTAVAPSIETYRFEVDGSVVIRTYYRVPTHADPVFGQMFRTYLPGNRDGA
jgi:hypothetical protein